MNSEDLQLTASLRLKILSFLPADLPVSDALRRMSEVGFSRVPLNERPAGHIECRRYVLRDDVLERLTEDVYLTIDVDCFDPSLVPSTGTPEPGGLQWYPVLKLLRQVFRERNVVACDVVELAPIPGLHAPDFLVAKLVYKLIGYKFFG
jgi:hypothetical protein